MNSPNKTINLGVVGATGLVGEAFLNIMKERKFPLGDLKLFASEASTGKAYEVLGKKSLVEPLKKDCFKGLDVVFFSSGDDISLEWAPQAVQAGAFAVDNSAAFRMNPTNALVVPEINFPIKLDKPQIIANPNCSTIQMVMAVNGLKKFGLKEIRLSSYQSVSGAGKSAVDELINQSKEFLQKGSFTLGTNFRKGIAFSCQPQIGGLDTEGFCSEETKIRLETQKILNLPKLPVSAVTIRIPTLNCHAEAVWVTLENECSRQEFIRAIAGTEGVVAEDSLGEFKTYHEVNNKDEVFVSRIRRDPMLVNTWIMWVTADNLRRGAVTNAIKIAERIFDIKK